MVLYLWLLAFFSGVISEVSLNERPFPTASLHWKHDLKIESLGKEQEWHFTITYPTNVDSNVLCPLVYFFSGFELKAKDYKAYAQKIAESGYVVVQYDAPALPLPNDRDEISAFPSIVEWIRSQFTRIPLPISIDLDSIAVGGHSRGGKLASLNVDRHPSVKALFMVEPVDGGIGYRPSFDYPSGIDALKRQNKKALILAASVSGPCNPKRHNYKKFWDELDDGSWLMFVENSGHMQFADPVAVKQMGLNLMCLIGSAESEVIMGDAEVGIVAWLESIFRLPNPDFAEMEMHLEEEFLSSMQAKEKSGELKFEIKGKERIEV